jgi:hypothetical protein
MFRSSVVLLAAVGVGACATSPRAVPGGGMPAPGRSNPSPAVTAPATPASTAPAGGSESSGAFVTRLGNDTLAIEQFTRTGDRLEGRIVSRSPTTRLGHYVVTLDAAGAPTRVDYSVRRADGTPFPGAAQSVSLTFGRDSGTREVRWADSGQTRRVALRAGTLPLVPNSYAVYELATRRLRAARTDSADVPMLGITAAQATMMPFAMYSPDSARMQYFGDPVYMRVDREGRLWGVDGSRTTNKVMVERVASANIAALASAFAAREQQSRPMGQASPRDTARATIGSAQLLVDYGRPSLRGRSAFGGLLVPYGEVWRTGANAATQLRTSANLTIGGANVPAGTYTLWTLPSATGTKLIINKQTGQWGTDYSAAQDLARVDAQTTALATPVEQFTIAIEPQGSSTGTLRLTWGTTQLSVPITVK